MSDSDRLVTPFMQAFRSAFKERDAKKPMVMVDEKGERVLSGRRSTKRGSALESELRSDLSRDISSLLNTVNMGSAEDISEYEYVTTSILNYGLTDLSVLSINDGEVDNLCDKLSTILRDFEPRLLRDSIAVERDSSVDRSSLRLRFLVSAEMKSTPSNIPVEFVADLELESGKMRIHRF